MIGSRSSRPTRILLGALFLLMVTGLGFYATRFAFFVFSPIQSPNGQGAIVEITKGKSPKELTHFLVSNGVLKPEDEGNFMLLGRVGRLWKRVKAGEYKFTPQMTPIEVFRILTSGVSLLHSLTVREGENMYEIADAVEKMGLAKHEVFLALCQDRKFMSSLGVPGLKDPRTKSLEGYLFPETYFLNKTMTAEDIIRGMVRKFSAVWGSEQEARAKALGMSQHEVLTLASMIEKETGAPQERPLISSVFHNRLQKKMRLQSDPTTIYGIWNRYDGNLHRADLSSETPYNTYYVPALPAGPIANPGREAIHAALFPSSSGFLYFVSHNDGTHEFTTSYEAHLNAVRKFQLDPKAREGKSWRDISRQKQVSVNKPTT
jgi:UPF0755 protein